MTLWGLAMQTNNSFLVEHLESRQMLSRAVPNAPSALIEATSTSSFITLNWTDASTNETGFRVQRLVCTKWHSFKPLKANVTMFTDTSLLAGKYYAYRIFAFNAAGLSRAAAFIGDAHTLAPGGVAAPTSIAATVLSPGHTIVQFNDLATNEAGYDIEASTNGPAGPWASVGNVAGSTTTGARAFDFTSAQPGISYTFRVTGFTEAGRFDASLVALAAPPMADTTSPVFKDGRFFTSDVTPSLNGSVAVNRRLTNSNGTPVTNYGTNGNFLFGSADPAQQPVQYLTRLPDGNVLSNSIWEEYHSQPYLSDQWHEDFGEEDGSVNPTSISFTTQYTVARQPSPAPLVYFVQSDGQIIVGSNGMYLEGVRNALTTTGPTLSVFSPHSVLRWQLPLSSAADSIAGIGNGLIAVTSGSHLTVYDAYGSQLLP
jgi:hypothetical protein